MQRDDLARIQFVTTQYRSLQGLRHVALIAFLLVLAVGPAPGRAGVVAAVAPYVVFQVADRFLDGWYGRRFGRVPAPPIWRSDRAAWLLIVVGGVLLEPMTRGGPSTFALAVGLASLRVVIRDWPWRARHLLTIVVCGIVLAVRIPLSLPAVLLVFGADAISAWLDHRFLTDALPPHPDAARLGGVVFARGSEEAVHEPD